MLLKYVLTHFTLFLRPCKALLPSGQLRLVGGGSPGVSSRTTLMVHDSDYIGNNKAGHRGADFCLGRLLPPAPTADVRHESQHCLSAAMPTTRPADVTRILMKIQNCLNLCLETNAGCCGRFFHSCKRF